MSPRHRQPAFFAALLSAVILAVAATQYATVGTDTLGNAIIASEPGASVLLNNVDVVARLTALEGQFTTMATQLSATQVQLIATQASLNFTQAQLSAAIVRISVLETENAQLQTVVVQIQCVDAWHDNCWAHGIAFGTERQHQQCRLIACQSSKRAVVAEYDPCRPGKL